MKILYTGSFRFPDKDAASQRVLGIGKALRKMGHEIVFCGWEKEPRIEDKINDEYIYQGFKYYSQAELGLPERGLFRRFIDYLALGNKTLGWIRRYNLTNKITHIIVYNSNSIFILRLKKFCKKNNITLVGDCTEWYEGSHLSGGRFGILNFDNNCRIRFVYPYIKNVIVISSFLKIFLEKKGCNTIVIPPLVDFDDSKWERTNTAPLQFPRKLKLIYAGDPGKKDILKQIIASLDFINKTSIKIEFNIIGLTAQQLSEQLSISTIPSYIFCEGRIQLNLVPKFYQKADFSILIRENIRYANAGFPTKLVESLSAGVPIITNKTSDIPNFIRNGENGFVLSEINSSAIKLVLKKIFALSDEQISEMKKHSLNSAKLNFDYNEYSSKLTRFFNSFS